MKSLAQNSIASEHVRTPSDTDAVELLHHFVNIPSVSGNERACVEHFVKTAAAWGFSSEIDEVGNGIATRCGPFVQQTNTTRPTELVLLGHIDTVPGNIPVRIENNILHGRGSVDAKGPLTAMLVAAARADIPAGCVVRVVAAVGEETPHSVGARHIAKSLRPHACIIGEPSGWDGVTLGYKGRLVMHAQVTQRSGHSAGPHGSAADALFAFWTECLRRVEQLNVNHNGAFDIIQSTVRTMSSSSNGLQETAQLQSGFRLPTWMSPHTLESHIREISENQPLQLTLEGHETAHVTDRNDIVVRALSNAIRASGARPHPKTKTGTADLNVVAPIWNCPIAAYGPGDSSLDHTPEERIELTEYLRSIQVLQQAITTICLHSGGVPYAAKATSV